LSMFVIWRSWRASIEVPLISELMFV